MFHWYLVMNICQWYYIIFKKEDMSSINWKFEVITEKWVKNYNIFNKISIHNYSIIFSLYNIND
jgi:hypothetical protein